MSDPLSSHPGPANGSGNAGTSHSADGSSNAEPADVTSPVVEGFEPADVTSPVVEGSAHGSMAPNGAFSRKGGVVGGVARALVPRDLLSIARVVGAFAIGGLAAWVMAPPGKNLRADPAPPTEVTLAGEALPIDGSEEQTLEVAHQIVRRALAAPLTVRIEGNAQPFVRRREELGAQLDHEWLAALVAQARDSRSSLRRAHAQIGSGRPLALPLPVRTLNERTLATFLTLKDEIDQPPIDAKYSLAKGTVSPDVPGRRLDVHATIERFDRAIAQNQTEIEAVTSGVPAARTAEALGKVEVTDVLGYFETKYARDNAHIDRTYNLKLAASRLDGHVILPGEVFDFNQVVGPRSEAYGYRVATVIAQGELVDGIGGGTCQISGTLHGAAFFAGLDIVDRKPHTRPSGYIKMGMDATVVYPTITLKLKNPLPFPVVLHEVVEDGVVRAEILGPKRTRDVTFVRRIDGVTPFREREISDPKIPAGEKVLAQRGIPGFKVTRFRVVREGAFAVRERMPDYYPPTTQIVRVGTGPKDDGFVPRDDSHAEYVADELLTISQGPSIRAKAWNERGGGTIENRVPGKYGSYGWTVREGLTTEWKREPKERPSDDNPGVD